MTSRWIVPMVALAMASGIGPGARAFGPGPDDSATLDAVEARLAPIVREACPGARFAREDDELVLRYRTQDFQVHGQFRDGTYAAEARKEEGPNARGVLLRVSVRGEPYDGPLILPQTLQRPYWRTWVGQVRRGPAEYLYVNLDHGHLTDEALVDRLRDALASFEVPDRGPTKDGAPRRP